MNRRLMALSLVVGLSFSQVPVQAGIFGGLALPRMNFVSTSMNILKRHPLLSAFTLSGVALGLAYWYNMQTKKHSQQLSPTDFTSDELLSNEEKIAKFLGDERLGDKRSASVNLIFAGSLGEDSFRAEVCRDGGFITVYITYTDSEKTINPDSAIVRADTPPGQKIEILKEQATELLEKINEKISFVREYNKSGKKVIFDEHTLSGLEIYVSKAINGDRPVDYKLGDFTLSYYSIDSKYSGQTNIGINVTSNTEECNIMYDNSFKILSDEFKKEATEGFVAKIQELVNGKWYDTIKFPETNY